MRRRIRFLWIVSLVLLDAAAVILAFSLAYWVRVNIPWPDPATNVEPFPHYLGMAVVQAVVMLLVFFFSRLYHLKRGISRLDEVSSLFAATSIGSMISIAISSLIFKDGVLTQGVPRGIVVYAWLLTIVFVSLGRLLHGALQASFRARGLGADRVIIVGTGEVGRMVLQKIQHTPRLGYDVVGFVDGRNPQEKIFGVPVLGDVEDLPRLIDEHDVNEIIIAMPEASHEDILTIISRCERGRVGIKVFPDVFQIIASEISIGDLGGLPLLTVRDVALRGWKLTLKRAVDIIGSAVGLVLLSPLMLLIAILIKLDSPGPVFYAQERMGLDAKPFWMLKFRSMRADAEANGPGWTTANDPRRTRLGAIIRRLSLDELPQLINVLLGEMSLVGPRPERPVFVEQFKRSIPRYMDRHWEKAGITGWAQVNGLRGDTSIVERTKYDLWYIENWSLWLDFKIILRTIINVFRSKNAY